MTDTSAPLLIPIPAAAAAPATAATAAAAPTPVGVTAKPAAVPKAKTALWKLKFIITEGGATKGASALHVGVLL